MVKSDININYLFLRALTTIRKPYLFKNMNCGQRIGAISENFPKAYFIYCKRDPLYTAQSLLLGREKVFGTRSKWWSIMPKEYSEILEHLPVKPLRFVN